MIELHSKLLNYISIYPEEMINKPKMLKFFEEHQNPFSNELQVGHFTASAFLLNHDQTKFLLMHHKKLNKWIQLGGHCDGDRDVLAAALREAKEESGIDEIEIVSDEIYDIDICYVPERNNEVAHYHYDIRFLLKTVNNDNFIKNHEANELRWFNFFDYPRLGLQLEPSVIRMIEKWL